MKDKAGKTVINVFRMDYKWKVKATTYHKELTFLGDLVPLDTFELDFDTQDEANFFAKNIDNTWQPGQ